MDRAVVGADVHEEEVVVQGWWAHPVELLELPLVDQDAPTSRR